MTGPASAYDILGVEPGADQAAVDLAYRQLIKRYHPDREGGDAVRAAEINRAYFELRRSPPPQTDRAPPADFAQALYAERLARRRYVVPPRRRRRQIWPLLAIALAAAIYVKREPLLELMADTRANILEAILSENGGELQELASARELRFDGPLDRSSVDKAIDRAAALVQSRNRQGLLQESRDCHRALRQQPTLERLDRCAAFDDAVLEIENREAIQEEGPFAASAVTARQMAAAKLLSRNYEAIEERLDRVRTHVQGALAPPEPEPRLITSSETSAEDRPAPFEAE